MAGRDTLLEDRMKQRIKVLEQHELPFKQVALDVLYLFLKKFGIEDMSPSVKDYEKLLKELKDQYGQEIQSIRTQKDNGDKFIQQTLFK